MGENKLVIRVAGDDPGLTASFWIDSPADNAITGSGDACRLIQNPVGAHSRRLTNTKLGQNVFKVVEVSNVILLLLQNCISSPDKGLRGVEIGSAIANDNEIPNCTIRSVGNASRHAINVLLRERAQSLDHPRTCGFVNEPDASLRALGTVRSSGNDCSIRCHGITLSLLSTTQHWQNGALESNQVCRGIDHSCDEGAISSR
mmetsp:Transcript_10151/g.18446  ORF Transcript_10151/g.18446 Transcript_10151/m.18446 type:complete len:202 (-) Transcript_10151:1131-1736(-)